MDSTTESVLWQPGALESMPHLEIGSIGPRELLRLATLLDLASVEFTLLAGESQEGPWLVSLPEKLAQSVVAMDVDEREVVAEIWSGSKELAGRMTEVDAAQTLEKMKEFLGNRPGPWALYVDTRDQQPKL